LVVSSADLLNLWRPIGAWEEHHSLAYGEGPRQTLDVYKPRHATKAPVVVFFYGGSWQGGSRDLYPFVGASKYCRRHCEAECVRSLEVDDQLALGRRLH
jgi:acetyl esterase/lipase